MKNIKNIADISGFGKTHPYEKACQSMLQKGWDWLQNRSNVKLKAYTYQGVYGILTPDSNEAKELSEVISTAVDGGCTGAMHQAVMQHLMYINKNGIDKWIKEIKAFKFCVKTKGE